MRRVAAVCALVALLGFALAGAAGAVSVYPLAGRGAGDFGAHGLYLGERDWSAPDSPTTNWAFNDDVTLTIRDDGTARIAGGLTRLYDALAHPALDLTWGLEIELRDPLAVAGGTDWQQLSLRLTEPEGLPYFSVLATTGWVGYAMPELGHPNVAEFRIDADGAYQFDAWYRHPDYWEYYRVGDTKADGPIPEPGAALLFGAGLLVTRWRLRRNR